MPKNRIREFRKELDLKQIQLAELIGVTQGTIRKYEYGEIDIPQSRLEKLSKVLHHSVDEILCKKPLDDCYQLWEQLYNNDGKLEKETTLLKCVQNLFGRETSDLLVLFSQFNEQGKKKALETLKDLSEIPKYTETDD